MKVKDGKSGWKEASTATRVRMAVATILQLALLIAALVDLKRRPAEAINGRKALWGAIVFVNFVGPIAYFIFGRKRRPELVG